MHLSAFIYSWSTISNAAFVALTLLSFVVNLAPCSMAANCPPYLTGPGSVGMGMPGSGMGQPNSVLAPSSSGYIGVHSVQAISNPSYSGAATSQSFSSPASVAGMQVMGLVELIGLYCDIYM